MPALNGVSFVEGELNDDVKVRELSIYRLCECLVALRKADELRQLIKQLRNFFDSTTKAKTAKIGKACLGFE